MAEGREQGPAHLLVVDDDPSAAHSLAETARSFGHEVTVALSWTEAVRKFCDVGIDLVLMDAVMPGVDGFKLTQLLRKRSQRYVPIVFVTGLNDLRTRELGVEAGADDYISKPVEPFELRVRITAMLRIRRLTEALADKSRELEQLATKDALTGLYNRRSFDERFDADFIRSQRYDRDLSILVIDIDHFKQVNDTFGHSVGDEVLSLLGSIISNNLRAPDQGFRYGGEEFVVLTPDTNIAGASVLAERLRCEFAKQTVASSAGQQTLSIGISGLELLGKNTDTEELFCTGDDALYRAKQTGRNQVCFYGEHNDQSTVIPIIPPITTLKAG